MKKLFLFMQLCLCAGIPVFAQQWGNYTLVATQSGTTTLLLDTNGTTVKTWTHGAAARTGYSCYLEPGGTLVRTVINSSNSFTGGPITGKVQKVNYAGNLLWDFTYSTANYCTHHDICVMPNGNVLLIAYERKTAAEVAQAGCSSFSGEMWPDKIVEVQPTGLTTGNIVWEWHAWDHLVQETDPNAANYQSSVLNHPELLDINYQASKDWLHVNGVDYNPMLDQIVISSHNTSEIYVIDHSTTTAEAASHTGGNSGKGGDFLYRFGNPEAYGATVAATIDVCHDAHWIPEDCPRGGMLAYYNNYGISNNASCGDIIQQPYLGNYQYQVTPGSVLSPNTYTKRIASAGFNSNMGSFQQLPNGNHLISIATAGIIKEFDSTGTLLWTKTMNGATPKVWRYSSCYVDSAAPPIPVVTQSGNTLSSSAATTYQWYKNGDLIAGATSQTYSPASSGNFVVRTTNTAGCVHQYSPTFKFTSATGLGTVTRSLTTAVYPNPATQTVRVNYKSLGSNVTISVLDAMGKIIMQKQNIEIIDLTGLPRGLYLVKLSNGETAELHKLLLQ
ncbi:MAG TPA: aryl-sulfate sulfotransferase [Flavipsychrobacter sp.]|nr:aryl-sulfate sulfotransferase [Flavipsychrobacter sp.]